ncbi:Transmembrane protein [Orchesella cincta]|uniref:Transmembrane protein n=1 Tax=Orchesella cincta TaxID=48709 RepID=A0A1D2MXT8_ORCCI|nr:Transmembrane protein [Orchesella cincta]
MPATDSADGHHYSSWTGLIYIFNLIVGTGALTLPSAFANAGWALSLSIILLLAFMSYVTVTFVIESMSVANAILYRRKIDRRSYDFDSGDSAILISATATNRRPQREERDPLIPPELAYHQPSESFSAMSDFEIKERTEMGRMAAMFFGRTGVYVFYACLAIYLYGDLAIYVAAVSKSLRDVFCTFVPENYTMDGNSTEIPDSAVCWMMNGTSIDRFQAYRIFTVMFILVLGPFAFCNVSKTKYLQIGTTIMRWLAFGVMIALALKILIKGEGKGHPIAANFYGLPNLFGVCVYSFMCHHSLPSLVTPINEKKNLFRLFMMDYGLITVFYLLLAFTGIFAFDNLRDLYTLNFEPNSANANISILMKVINYFLALFPVFTLSTNFPIIAITLKNNLKSLFNIHDDSGMGLSGLTHYCSQVLFPLAAIIPPFIVAVFVENVQVLVGITGSYAGNAIQYIIPVLLCYRARQCCMSSFGMDVNPYASPFRHKYWLWGVFTWAVVSVGFVTVNHVISLTRML